MKTSMLLLVLGAAISANAGVGAHGENVVSCPGTPIVTLDYYNAALPTNKGPVQTVDVSKMSADQAFAFVRSRFDGSPFQREFDLHSQRLGPMESWIAADLKSIDDSHEPYALPPGCTRRTAAARQGKMMYIDPSVVNQMSPGQIGLLRAHEVFYEMSGGDSSEPVRDIFRFLLAVQVDWVQLAPYLEKLAPLYYWKIANGSKFVADKGNPVKTPGDFQIVSGAALSYWHDGETGPLARAYYYLTCDPAGQTCAIRKQELVQGKSPDLMGCTLGYDQFNNATRMILQCPAWGGRSATFHLKEL